jgi:glycosidase
MKALATLALLLAGAASVAEPRINSVARTPEGWNVTVSGVAAPRFELDGKAVPARPAGKGDSDTTTWLLPATDAAGPARLVLRDGAKDLLALRLGAQTPAEAPFNDWSIYHLWLETFRNGTGTNDRAGLRRWVHPNYAGGDLQGVLEKLDYLKSLGVNAVWLSPMFGSETSHGYDVTNYYRVGDAVSVPGDRDAAMALYRKTVDALHAAGIRVVLDLPLNHGSRSYERKEGDPNGLKPTSTSAQQEAEKLWESWNSNFRYWNFQDANTRKFLVEAGRFWLTEGKADGFRLDYVRGVPHDFWAEFYAQVKATKPSAIVFGEAWQDAAAPLPNAEDIATYYAPVPGTGRQFDGLLEFPLQMVMTEVFARGDGSATDLELWLQKTGALYRGLGSPVYFLDNHDMSRFLAWPQQHGEDRLIAALGFMASLSSPIVIFYGTETGISGGRAEPGFHDTGRIPMPWNSLDTALIGRVSEILAARSKLPAITHGGRTPVYGDEDVLVMRKHHPSGDVLVGVNVGNAQRKVSFAPDAGQGPGRTWQAVLGATTPKATADGKLEWTLPPLSTNWASLTR